MFIEILKTLIDLLKASVRPVITIGFAGAIIIGFFKELVSPEAFIGLAVLVVKYWFDSRGKPNESPVPPQRP